MRGSREDTYVLEGDEMSDTNDRCVFEHSDYCCPPKEWKDFKCSKALPMEEGDITNKCGATDYDLFTEEEREEMEKLK